MASQPSLLTSHQVPENSEGLPRLCPLRIRAGDAQSWVDPPGPLQACSSGQRPSSASADPLPRCPSCRDTQ